MLVTAVLNEVIRSGAYYHFSPWMMLALTLHVETGRMWFMPGKGVCVYGFLPEWQPDTNFIVTELLKMHPIGKVVYILWISGNFRKSDVKGFYNILPKEVEWIAYWKIRRQRYELIPVRR